MNSYFLDIEALWLHSLSYKIVESIQYCILMTEAHMGKNDQILFFWTNIELFRIGLIVRQAHNNRCLKLLSPEAAAEGHLPSVLSKVPCQPRRCTW